MTSACPLCNESDYKVIGKPKTNHISKDFIDKIFNVVQCTNCDVYYVAPPILFSDEQWSILYNSAYFSSQSNWLIRKRAKELKQRFNKSLSYLTTTKNISFLDVGAGEGNTLIEGLERGWDVTGIDIVDNRVNGAKADGIKFITSKFLEYEFPNDHFDFIYLDSVLEHVVNPKEYLQKIAKILKAGGIVYLGVPNEDSLFNDIRRIIFTVLGKKDISVKIVPFDTPYHIIGFNKASLHYIFNLAGLKINFMRNLGRKFEFLSFKPNTKGFWISLFVLLPIEFIGSLLKKDVYYEAYLTKK